MYLISLQTQKTSTAFTNLLNAALYQCVEKLNISNHPFAFCKIDPPSFKAGETCSDLFIRGANDNVLEEELISTLGIVQVVRCCISLLLHFSIFLCITFANVQKEAFGIIDATK